MRQGSRLGITIFLGFLVVLFGMEARVWTAEDELQIGVPDLPRRVGKELPPFEPGYGIDLGVFRLHPLFKSIVEYNDNIKLQDSDDKEDVIFTQTPGLIGEVKFLDHRFEAGYGMEIESFAKDSEESTTNHMAHGVLELNFNDFHVVAQDLFEKATQRAFSETSERDKLITNTFDILSRYDRPKWAAEFDWRHNTIDHQVERLDVNDYGENVLAMLGGYKILPKTLILMETDLGFVRYRNDGNANQGYWQIFGGVRGEPREDVNMTAKIGFQERQLGDVPGLGPQSDFEGVVAMVDFLYDPTDDDSFRLGYTRSVKTSTFADNSWYRQDRIFTSYRKRFRRKWTVTPLFSWQLNDYPEEGTVEGITKRRDDNFWQASVDLRYEIQKWLSTGLAYRFRVRNSNIDPLDFENHRVIFDVTFAY